MATMIIKKSYANSTFGYINQRTFLMKSGTRLLWFCKNVSKFLWRLLLC